MKKLILVLFALALVHTTAFSKSALEKFFEKYSDMDEVTSVQVSPGAFSNTLSLNDSKVQNILDGIEDVNILSCKKEEGSKEIAKISKKMVADAMKIAKSGDFKSLMQVKDGKERVSMYLNSKPQKTKNFLMIVSEEDEATVIWIRGDIDMKSMTNFQKYLSPKHQMNLRMEMDEEEEDEKGVKSKKEDSDGSEEVEQEVE